MDTLCLGLLTVLGASKQLVFQTQGGGQVEAVVEEAV